MVRFVFTERKRKTQDLIDCEWCVCWCVCLHACVCACVTTFQRELCSTTSHVLARKVSALIITIHGHLDLPIG